MAVTHHWDGTGLVAIKWPNRGECDICGKPEKILEFNPVKGWLCSPCAEASY